MQAIKIATYNIHKGFSSFNRRLVLHQLRERLQLLNADIVFLQESQGEHKQRLMRVANYPEQPQHEFLANECWPHVIYGRNAVYEAGHHGNALLSRWPIIQFRNQDISAHRFEQRGLLHAEISLTSATPLHCLCTHFGLFSRGRELQATWLLDYVNTSIPVDAPLIIAGDFNDWRNQLGRKLANQLGMFDVFDLVQGKPARSFPARLPLLRLDRIYVRGVTVLNAEVHRGGPSDHAVLSSLMQLPLVSDERAAVDESIKSR